MPFAAVFGERIVLAGNGGLAQMDLAPGGDLELSEDILAIDPARIADVKEDLTIAGGKVVFER